MAVPGMGLKFPVQVGIELESKAPCPPRESPSSPSLQVLVIYKFPRYDHTTPEQNLVSPSGSVGGESTVSPFLFCPEPSSFKPTWQALGFL